MILVAIDNVFFIIYDIGYNLQYRPAPVATSLVLHSDDQKQPNIGASGRITAGDSHGV